MALDVELLSEGREFDLKEPGDMALGGTGGGGCLFGLYNDPLTFKNIISFQLVQRLPFLLLI